MKATGHTSEFDLKKDHKVGYNKRNTGQKNQAKVNQLAPRYKIITNFDIGLKLIIFSWLR